jgi:hypothetical protein
VFPHYTAKADKQQTSIARRVVFGAANMSTVLDPGWMTSQARNASTQGETLWQLSVEEMVK